jgi:small-conductance mechanosensitive channel
MLLLTTLIAGVMAASARDADPAAGPGDASPETAPVVVDGHPLFTLRGIATFPAERRAAAVAGRIRALARDRSFDPATLTVGSDDRYTWIGPQAGPIVRIHEIDAEIEGVDRRTLGDIYVTRIREAIVAYRAARTREALVSSAWRAGLATLLAALAFVVLRRALVALHRRLERRYADRVKTVNIRSFEVVRADRIRTLARGLLRLLRALSLIAVVLIYLRYLLALLPWTRGTATQFDGWMIAPLAMIGSGLIAALPDLIFLAVLFIVTRFLIRLLHLFFMAVGRGDVELGGFEPEWAEPTYKIVRLAVVVFVIIVAYPYIPGSSSAAFQGVSLFIGVVFSLGSSSWISNVIAGYTMIYRRAFREGDVVKIGGVTGLVSRVRLQVTHLRTPKNEEVVVPNSSILNSEVVNYSTLARTDGLILHTTVGIGYETPWRQVEAMLTEAAARTAGLRQDPAPFVNQTMLGDFAVTYQINVYCDDPRAMPRLYSALHRNILDVFNEYGVQIMTPAYEGDPPEPKVVPPDKWHLPPARKP